MSEKKGRLFIWTPLLLSLILVLGIWIGFYLHTFLKSKRTIDTVLERNDRLEQIIDLVNQQYVDSVNTDILFKDAINGIIRHLDPHTVYIPAEDAVSANESLDGGFFGIGVEFSIVRDTIRVTSVVADGPAEQAGLEIGDQLIKVGDSVVAGSKITSERIIHLLKGKQRSRVYVTLKDGFSGKLKQVPIVRDIVPIYSVEASIKLDSTTGYIKINRFSATTADEFSRALKRLKVQGIKQLIVDLRENPGGYLDAATMIADEFLDGNKLIVYTKGKSTQKTEYKAGDAGLFEKGRLAILVDESSASASEILAGAIQDWDRGVIVGRRTFGKGLVQQQYELDDGSALRLTIARYYTPSGRSIQRSFVKGREAYEKDFEKRFEDGELTVADTASFDTTSYFTANHRLVFGGGGIKPDVYVPYDTSHLSNALLTIVFSESVKNILWDYFLKNRKNLVYKNIEDYAEHFAGEGEITNKYIQTLNAKDRVVAAKVLQKPANEQYFKLLVKAQLARFLFHDNGYYAISNKDDEMIKRTLQIMHSNMYLKIIGG